MSILLVAIVLLAVFAVGVLLMRSTSSHGQAVFEQLKELQARQERLEKSESVQLLNQNVLGLRQNLDHKIKEVNDRLNSAAEVFTRVQHGLGRLDKLGESVEGLQALLGSQKLRGGLGEQVMVDVLSEFVPAACRDTQVTLSSGVRVDAVVKTSKGMIPIDAKFPLENFIRAADATDDSERAAALHELQKNARKHIRDIASKYICPGETVDFAVMYVPSDSVFAAIQEDPAITADAAQRRVFVVSPATFCALLSLILLNLEGERLADEARSVITTLRGIQQQSGKFEDQLKVAAGHIRNAGNAFDLTGKQWQKLKNSIDSAAHLNMPESDDELEPLGDMEQFDTPELLDPEPQELKVA